ncbi:MAG: inositol monophosphatase family protein [Caulobacteraceae bacterium]
MPWRRSTTSTAASRWISSIKFCRIAEGAADIYPRHGTTMEWDTAAGHAVLIAAGGPGYDAGGRAVRLRQGQRRLQERLVRGAGAGRTVTASGGAGSAAPGACRARAPCGGRRRSRSRRQPARGGGRGGRRRRRRPRPFRQPRASAAPAAARAMDRARTIAFGFMVVLSASMAMRPALESARRRLRFPAAPQVKFR